MPAAKRSRKKQDSFIVAVPNRTLFNGRVASDQQERVFRWVENDLGNLVLIAVAGSGKTTTLVEMTRHMQGTVALAAYNKAIAEEISVKLAEVGSRAKASTFHSFGFTAIRNITKGVTATGTIQATKTVQVGSQVFAWP